MKPWWQAASPSALRETNSRRQHEQATGSDWIPSSDSGVALIRESSRTQWKTPQTDMPSPQMVPAASTFLCNSSLGAGYCVRPRPAGHRAGLRGAGPARRDGRFPADHFASQRGCDHDPGGGRFLSRPYVTSKHRPAGNSRPGRITFLCSDRPSDVFGITPLPCS